MVRTDPFRVWSVIKDASEPPWSPRCLRVPSKDKSGLKIGPQMWGPWGQVPRSGGRGLRVPSVCSSSVISGCCLQIPVAIFSFLKKIYWSLADVQTPHSSTLAGKIPWTEEPGGLQSIGSLRVRHDWATSLSLFTFMHWRRKWQPTPVFLPGESQEWLSLVGCRLWGHTESDTTEVT